MFKIVKILLLILTILICWFIGYTQGQSKAFSCFQDENANTLYCLEHRGNIDYIDLNK